MSYLKVLCFCVLKDIWDLRSDMARHLLNVFQLLDLVINHAANSTDGLLSKMLTFDQLLQEYEHAAWPRGLGTTELPPSWPIPPHSMLRRDQFSPVAYMD